MTMPVNGFSKTAVRDYAAANNIKYTAALRVFENRPGVGDDLSLLTYLTEKSKDATPFGDFARDFIADPEYSGNSTGGDMASWLEEGIGDSAYEGVDVEACWEDFNRWRSTRGGLRTYVRDCDYRYTEHDDAAVAALGADVRLGVFDESPKGLADALPIIESEHPEALTWALSVLDTQERLDWDHERGLDSWIIDRDPQLKGYCNHDPNYGHVRWVDTLPSFSEGPASTFSTGFAVYLGVIAPGQEDKPFAAKRNWEFRLEAPENVDPARVFEAALSDGQVWRSYSGTFNRLDLYVRYPEGRMSV